MAWTLDEVFEDSSLYMSAVPGTWRNHKVQPRARYKGSRIRPDICEDRPAQLKNDVEYIEFSLIDLRDFSWPNHGTRLGQANSGLSTVLAGHSIG